MRALTILLLLGPLTVNCEALAAASTGGVERDGEASRQTLPVADRAHGGEAGARWIGPDGEPLPFRGQAEVEEFLRTAKVISAPAAYHMASTVLSAYLRAK